MLAKIGSPAKVQPNPSLQPTCYSWLRQPTQAAELKRWASPRCSTKGDR